MVRRYAPGGFHARDDCQLLRGRVRTNRLIRPDDGIAGKLPDRRNRKKEKKNQKGRKNFTATPHFMTNTHHPGQ
jgi:hypothetical protein